MSRFQILISSRGINEGNRFPSGSRFSRAKAILAALAVTSAVIGFLLAALVLGSIIATVMLVVFVLALSVAMVRVLLGRARSRAGVVVSQDRRRIRERLRRAAAEPPADEETPPNSGPY